MAKYSITSPKIYGDIICEYCNTNGLLNKFEINATLTTVQHKAIIDLLPKTQPELQIIKDTIPRIEIIKLPDKITFEMAWVRYDNKLLSSKKKSLAKWEKMPEAEQAKAYYHIQKYHAQRGTTAPKYFETYLNSEIWNNN